MLDSILVLAATETGAHAAAEGPAGLIPTFDIHWKIIIAQTVNFVIVAVALWKFAFKPVLATMEERQKKIADGLQHAEEAKQQLASAEREKAERLREANSEAQTIITQAKSRAEQLGADEKQKVDAELVEKRRRADDAIAQERQRVLSEARQDIARLVVLTSGRVLKKELSDEEKSRLNSSASAEMASLN